MPEQGHSEEFELMTLLDRTQNDTKGREGEREGRIIIIIIL